MKQKLDKQAEEISNKIKNSNKSFREKFSEFWANLKSKFSKKGGSDAPKKP